MKVLKATQARLSFTCVEMRDCEHPPEGRCSPQGLLQQVIECAETYGVPLAGENALQRYVAVSVFACVSACSRMSAPLLHCVMYNARKGCARRQR